MIELLKAIASKRNGIVKLGAAALAVFYGGYLLFMIGDTIEEHTISYWDGVAGAFIFGFFAWTILLPWDGEK